MDHSAVMDRWVINYNASNKLWHRVDEQKTGVYNAATRCGLSFYYPSAQVVFRHPRERRPNYPDCQECK